MTARTPNGNSAYRQALDHARAKQQQWDATLEVSRLRAEVKALRRQLREEVARTQRWRLKHQAVRHELTELVVRVKFMERELSRR